MDPRLEQLGRGPIPEGPEVIPGSTDLASAFNASWGTTQGATAPQEEQADRVDTAQRTEHLTALKERRDRELTEILNNYELTDQARTERTREAREKWDSKIEEEVQAILQRITEEDAKLERELYRRGKPTDQTRELFLARLHRETTDRLVAGEDPVLMYEDAVKFGDGDLRRLLEQVAVPWLENTEQRARFNALVSENEPQWKKKIRAKRAAIAEERRSLELGFSLQGIRF